MKMLYEGIRGFLVDYLVNSLSYYLNYPFTKPWRINFDITHECQLRCLMCNIWKKKVDKKSELKLSELKKLVDEAKEWGIDHISFAGGETLMRKNITIPLIKYASSKNMRTDLITNGIALDERTCKKLLESGVSKISLSVDGAKEKTHDLIRGKGTFRKIIKAAKILRKMRRKYNKKVELEFTTVITGYNFRELVGIFNLMNSLGFDYINYQVVSPDNTFMSDISTYYSFYNSPLWVNGKDIEKLEKIVKKLVLLKKLTGKIRNTRGYLLAIPRYFKEKEKFKLGKCIAGFSYLNIDPYGNVNVCGFGPNLNVRKKSLKDIWYSRKYKKTRILIKRCKRPCLMLCYERLSFKNLFQAWLELRGWLR